MRPFALALLILLIAVPGFAQTFTLSATSNCPDLPDGYQLGLNTGTYHIEYVSGAWSPIADDAINGGYAWSSRVHVYIYTTGQTGIIGSGPLPGLYLTPELAEAAAKGIYVLILPRNSVVSFWLAETVNNFNDCLDNRGSVTLRFVQALPVHPTTWGAVKALYQ